ncbi:hypothetical protein NDU88_003597 [Pleurodeles waltl]|uniref:Uncharacterized protein n=1 Tax=Pleurodeles waltl TaxID=8319 RepID=A0AAV7VI97_PLEWA|nr:hypothetical protein NDU88_003597 [Pleurodeles waltl]
MHHLLAASLEFLMHTAERRQSTEDFDYLNPLNALERYPLTAYQADPEIIDDPPNHGKHGTHTSQVIKKKNEASTMRVEAPSGYSVVVQQLTFVFNPDPGGPLGTSWLLPCLSMGSLTFQGDAGGSLGVCAPCRFTGCSAGRTWHQQGRAPKAEQPRGQAATHLRLEPWPFSRSRCRLCRIFSPGSARVSPSMTTPRGRTPRSLRGVAVRQPL